MTDTRLQERRLAAIMFSDICGYSSRMGESEEALQNWRRAGAEWYLFLEK